MPVAKPILGFGRWTEEVTFTASSAATGHGAANLGTMPLGMVWESTSITGQWIKGEFPIKRPVGGFLLCRILEFTNGATFRIRLYDDDAATQAELLYDSDADASQLYGGEIFPEVYPDLEWEDDEWMTGKYTEAEKQDAVFCRPFVLPQLLLAKSFRIDFADPLNPNAFFRLGMVDVFRGNRLSRGIALGPVEGYEPRTTSVQAYGGAEYFNRLTKPATFEGDLRYLPRDEAKGVVQELARQHDRDRPFAWIPDIDDGRHWLRDCWLARWAQLPSQQRLAAKFHGVPLKLKQAF